MELSKKIVESVVKELVEKYGISKDRLKALALDHLRQFLQMIQKKEEQKIKELK